MNATEGPILLVGRTRRWKPLPSCNVPKGPVHEVRTLPGNLVGWGETKQEAVHRVMAVLEMAAANAGSLDAWYSAAEEAMTAAERAEFEAKLALWARAQAPDP